jgi:hypothetical protein
LAALACTLLLGAGPAAAHHILGIPHYAYDEQYPQTPVLTYKVEAGPYDVKMTGYPGIPQPGERVSLHVYIRERRSGMPYDEGVTLTVTRDRWIGADPIVYGPMQATLEEAVYKFFPELPVEANYTARIAFEGRVEPWSIDLPMVVGEPGSPWAVLGGVAAATAVFLLVMRAVRIKIRRRQLIERRCGGDLPKGLVES